MRDPMEYSYFLLFHYANFLTLAMPDEAPTDRLYATIRGAATRAANRALSDLHAFRAVSAAAAAPPITG